MSVGLIMLCALSPLSSSIYVNCLTATKTGSAFTIVHSPLLPLLHYEPPPPFPIAMCLRFSVHMFLPILYQARNIRSLFFSASFWFRSIWKVRNHPSIDHFRQGSSSLSRVSVFVSFLRIYKNKKPYHCHWIVPHWKNYRNNVSTE